jgi:hypothetical protein
MAVAPIMVIPAIMNKIACKNFELLILSLTSLLFFYREVKI